MVLLRYVLVELLENALTHARERGYERSAVWVAANYFPRTDEVRFAFVDNGCGFLESLRDHPEVRRHASDARAIKVAMEPFISSNRGVGILDETSNQGIGLTISRDIVLDSAGYIRITSGSSSIKQDIASQKNFTHASRWQGSIVEVKLRRDSLLNVGLGGIAARYQHAPTPGIQFT